MLQQHTATNDYEDRVLVVANNWLNKKIWTQHLAVCIGKEIGEEVNNMSLLAQLTIIQVRHQFVYPSSTSLRISNIEHCIQTHAEEIEALGLATAKIVQEDIEEAISEIWRLLQCGIGEEWNIREPRELDVNAQLPPYNPEPVEPANAA